MSLEFAGLFVVECDVGNTNIGLSGPAGDAATDDVVDVAAPIAKRSSPSQQEGSGKLLLIVLQRNFWTMLGSCSGLLHTHIDQLKAPTNPLPQPNRPTTSSSTIACVTTGLAWAAATFAAATLS
jgi:hypothetical protein